MFHICFKLLFELTKLCHANLQIFSGAGAGGGGGGRGGGGGGDCGLGAGGGGIT